MTDKNKKLTNQVDLRPVVLPDDEDFLKDLYFSTRDDLEFTAARRAAKTGLYCNAILRARSSNTLFNFRTQATI